VATIAAAITIDSRIAPNNLVFGAMAKAGMGMNNNNHIEFHAANGIVYHLMR